MMVLRRQLNGYRCSIRGSRVGATIVGDPRCRETPHVIPTIWYSYRDDQLVTMYVPSIRSAGTSINACSMRTALPIMHC